MEFDLVHHTHLLMVAGSRAYGLDRPDSDVDLKGVAVPPVAWFFGFRRSFEQADDPASLAPFAPLLTDIEQQVAASKGLEGSVYGLQKFARLAADCNPHVLDLLFCRDEEVRLRTPLGDRLRAERKRFLSVRARYSFGSYARSQLKRIQGHRRWLLDPPKRQPTRADFDLPEHTVLPREQLLAAEAEIRRKMDSWNLDLDGLEKAQKEAVRDRIATTLAEIGVGADERWTVAARSVGLDDNLLEVMKRERGHRSASKQWSAYQRWKRERNPARAALEAAHGYDTKHASHLVRLVRMAVEILETGEVHVWRGDRDADELRAVRDGAWSYEALMTWAEGQQARLNALEKDPAVPLRVDLDGIDALVVELVELAIRG